MITVQFLKDHAAADGRQFHKGEVAAVPGGVASELLKAGVAKLRIAATPVETKEEQT